MRILLAAILIVWLSFSAWCKKEFQHISNPFVSPEEEDHSVKETCECECGFVSVDHTCKDVDECEDYTQPCPLEPEHLCYNVLGSFICIRGQGWVTSFRYRWGNRTDCCAGGGTMFDVSYHHDSEPLYTDSSQDEFDIWIEFVEYIVPKVIHAIKVWAVACILYFVLMGWLTMLDVIREWMATIWMCGL